MERERFDDEDLAEREIGDNDKADGDIEHDTDGADKRETRDAEAKDDLS